MPKRFLKIMGPSNIWEAGEYAQAWHRRRHLALLSLLDMGEKKRLRSVLEVGCGVGFAAKCYKDAGFLEGMTYLGIDIEENALEIARKKVPGLGFRNVDITREGVGAKFDLVIADSVLEHLEKPEGAVGRIRAAMSAGGILLLSVPYKESHTSKYALLGYHKTTGIDEQLLEEILAPFFAPVSFEKYPIPELRRESGIGTLLFAKAIIS